MRLVLLAVTIGLMACGPSARASPATVAATPIPRCADGRPQPEIDHAGALPFPVISSEIVCVANALSDATAHDRAYRLRDGRMLHVYERTAMLPSKPMQPPLASGNITVGAASWRWLVLDFPRQVLELDLDRADLYVELDVPMSDRDLDLRLLSALASSLVLP